MDSIQRRGFIGRMIGAASAADAWLKDVQGTHRTFFGVAYNRQ